MDSEKTKKLRAELAAAEAQDLADLWKGGVVRGPPIMTPTAFFEKWSAHLSVSSTQELAAMKEGFKYDLNSAVLRMIERAALGHFQREGSDDWRVK